MKKLVGWMFGLGAFGGLFLGVFIWFYQLPIEVLCQTESADAIIVLGGGRGDRSSEALRLYHEGLADTVFVTGDGGRAYNALVAGGVRKDAIVHEKDAESTLENARFLKPFLERDKIESAVIVTSWFHTYRSLKIFEATFPGVEFCVSYQPAPIELDPYLKAMLRREKLACLYVTLLRGINCIKL